MFSGERIVKLLGDEDWWALPVNSWVRAQRGIILCKNCDHLLPGFRLGRFPDPVDVPMTQLPDRATYAGISQAGVSLIHQRLLEFLQPNLPAHSLGRCYWEDGRPISAFRTIYFRDTFSMRGDSATNYYNCKHCGFVGCISLHPYVLREELGDGSIFVDEIFELYLAEDFARRFPWGNFRDLRPVMIDVRDTPLPGDPFPGHSSKSPDE